jgi:23S rRNA (cytidine1920-2'-O)/16S rRNA (cytidine1409-2'-O)-methyltransferase
MVARGLVATRSQAESYIKLGEVRVDDKVVTKSGYFVGEDAVIKLTAAEQYVSRAALKLASVAHVLKIDFKGKTVLDVGSSTGGFTDFALQHGAQKVIDVEVGTNQLHPSLRGDARIELHEQTDIREIESRVKSHESRKNTQTRKPKLVTLDSEPDVIVIDVSFISLREILPHIVDSIAGPGSMIVAMVKPQFEAAASDFKHKGVIKNDRMRREILKSFEAWVAKYCVTIDKSDSQVTGAKGNKERFYMLRKTLSRTNL